MKTDSLKILSIGAGAIGTYIGGSLALAGHPVAFVELPHNAATLREGALRLKLGEMQHEIPFPTVFDSLEAALEADEYDVMLFALKSYDTETMLGLMKPLKEKLPPVLCLQNGVENEVKIANAIGEDKVLYGTVTSAVGRLGLGNIVLERLRGMGVAAGHPLSERLVAALDGAGLNAKLYPHGLGMKWSKMLTNLLANASSAILDMTPAEIYANPQTCRMEISQIREALAIMRAEKIPVTNLPGTPVKALAWGFRWLPAFLMRPLLVKMIGEGRGEKMPSFHIDLHAGREKSEVDYLNGAVSRGGRAQGIKTPVNDTLTQILLGLTNGRLPLEAYAKQPEVFVKEVTEAALRSIGL
jgi:2-dehydropantoate 2-reductase